MRFIITPDQEYLLSVLNATRAMRIGQAARLLAKLGGWKDAEYAARCLGQLRHIRKVCISGDMVALPSVNGAPADEDMLAAVDVMLDLTEIRVQEASSSVQPYKLCFLSEQKNGIGNYAVMAVRPSVEAAASAKLDASGHGGRTVIFLLSDISQAEGIKTALPHFFALNDCGKCRYLSGEPQGKAYNQNI